MPKKKEPNKDIPIEEPHIAFMIPHRECRFCGNSYYGLETEHMECYLKYYKKPKKNKTKFKLEVTTTG